MEMFLAGQKKKKSAFSRSYFNIWVSECLLTKYIRAKLDPLRWPAARGSFSDSNYEKQLRTKNEIVDSARDVITKFSCFSSFFSSLEIPKTKRDCFMSHLILSFSEHAKEGRREREKKRRKGL